jgi:hypothetical protein
MFDRAILSLCLSAALSAAVAAQDLPHDGGLGELTHRAWL